MDIKPCCWEITPFKLLASPKLWLQPCLTLYQNLTLITTGTWLQFLDLNREGMERVAAAMGADTSVEELSRMVEDLSRLH